MKMHGIIAAVIAVTTSVAAAQEMEGAPVGTPQIDPVKALWGTPEMYQLAHVSVLWFTRHEQGWRATVNFDDGQRAFGIGKTQKAALIDAIRQRRPDPRYTPVIIRK